jgi:acyl-CoA dehydrogenase
MDSHLDWPFLTDNHRQLARQTSAWIQATLADITPTPNRGNDVDAICQQWVHALGNAGWLAHCIAPPAAAAPRQLDCRALCLLRETLATHSTLADFACAMQGLGAGPISLFGNETQRQHYLLRVARGEAIAAFALSESEAGSDAAALKCRARRELDGYWRIDGEKTWVSNGGIANFYIVFARSTEGICAFIVDADSAGLEVAERIVTLSPHPMARLIFNGCRVPATQLIGAPGAGLKIALTTLDTFRPTVAAAALGIAQRALTAACTHARTRRLFDGTLADLQLTQARLADMATALDAARLLTYRAAWRHDTHGTDRQTAAMAKLFATEQAQQIVDAAVQLLGARGVCCGEPLEALYRDVRALRIYEGASEIQQLVIARQLLRESGTA